MQIVYSFNNNCILQEKVQYYDIATEKRREFDGAMAEFNKKMVSNLSFSWLVRNSCLPIYGIYNLSSAAWQENGDFEETDEESEFDE